MWRRFVAACGAAVMVASLFVACDGSPAAPDPNRPQGPVLLLRLEIAGPASVGPGETAQFTATAFYSDGSSRNVSGSSVWRTSSASVLSIASTGLATGGGLGEVSISASFGGRTATQTPVLVLKPGTYRLTGMVRDVGLPVSGAQVAVSAGPAEGLTTTTTADGAYRLYGVVGDAEIRVRQPGFEELRKRILVTSHQTLDFDLALSSPRDRVNGLWSLTVTAADECRTVLPDEALRRRYRVVLSQDGPGQDGPRVTATLEGATFHTIGNRTFNVFHGRIDPDRLRFDIVRTGCYYYSLCYFIPGDVLEQLQAPNTLLSFGGAIVLGGSGDTRSGALAGVIETFSGGPPYSAASSCKSSGHRVELTR